MEKDFFIKELKDAYNTHKKYFWVSRKIEDMPESLNLLKEFTIFLDENYANPPIQQRYWHIIKDTKEVPRCICGDTLNFNGINKGGYRISCSKKECKAIAMKKTNMTKYGTLSVMNVLEIKDKRKNTIKKKYGVDEIFQLESTKKSKDIKVKERKIEYLNDAIGINKYNILDEKNIEYFCDKCQKTTISHIQSVYNKRYDLCLYCNPKNSNTSSYENIIADWLKELGIKYVQNDKKVLDGLEIDLFLPDYNLGIEFNGIYWHSSKFKNSNYHKNKFDIAKSKNVNLIQIWEDMWHKKEDVIKSIIQSKLNINTKNIYARKTIVKEISIKEAKEFCETNHLHGYVNSTIKIGLFYEDKLVSVMTFGKRSIGKNKNLATEILRYCTLLDYRITGGASKLLKFYLRRNPNTQEVVSFSYNDLGINSTYKKLNFEEISVSYGYFYFKDGYRQHRYNFQKRKLVDKYGEDSKDLTEFQIMEKLDYLRCYDSGSTKWLLKIKPAI